MSEADQTHMTQLLAGLRQGDHTVELRAAGVRSPSARVSVAQGQTVHLMLQLPGGPPK